MAFPSIADIKIYIGNLFTGSEWDYNFEKIISFFGNGVDKFDASFDNLSANTITGNVSNCTGFPSVDIPLIAGENISKGNVLRVKNGMWYLATNSSDEGVTNVYGLATANAISGNEVSARRGVVSGVLTGLTTDIYYLSTNGNMTKTKPSPRSIPLGFGKSSTDFVFICPTFEPSLTVPKINIGSLTTGSIPFVGTNKDIIDNNSKLFWDNTNNRAGINTNTPSYSLDVNGTINSNSTINASKYSIGGKDIPVIRPWGMINWDGGNIVTISSMTAFTYQATYNGHPNCVIIDKTSHGVVLNDSITFSSQTGNNAILNGTWRVIDVPSTSQFVIKIVSSSIGSMTTSGITCQKIHVYRKTDLIDAVAYSGGGVFRVLFNQSISTDYGVIVSGGGVISNSARILTYGVPQSTYVDVGNLGIINSYSAIAVENCTCTIWY